MRMCYPVAIRVYTRALCRRRWADSLPWFSTASGTQASHNFARVAQILCMSGGVRTVRLSGHRLPGLARGRECKTGRDEDMSWCMSNEQGTDTKCASSLAGLRMVQHTHVHTHLTPRPSFVASSRSPLAPPCCSANAIMPCHIAATGGHRGGGAP
jgi:hypothetical protein